MAVPSKLIISEVSATLVTVNTIEARSSLSASPPAPPASTVQDVNSDTALPSSAKVGVPPVQAMLGSSLIAVTVTAKLSESVFGPSSLRIVKVASVLSLDALVQVMVGRAVLMLAIVPESVTSASGVPCVLEAS